MQINKAIQLNDGKVEVTGLITPVELETVLTVGLATLLRLGALNFEFPHEQEVSDENPSS